MKIHPPIPDIPADAPYKNDLFKRKEFGDSLFSLFKSVQENIVLCVDAPWGDGKTTFAYMWRADLKKRGVNCIYFDAYAHDYVDDPFVSFCGEILSLAETSFADDATIQSIKKDFKSKAKRIGARLFYTGARIGLKAISFGGADNSDLKDLGKVKGDFTGSTPSGLSTLMETMLDDYMASKKSLEEFRGQLSALGAAVRAKQDFPLLIVVDELDRCRPDFALSLIERIKHLFAAQDVSFLLLANTAQLQNYVKTIYGPNMDDAENYLGKFFTLTAALPQNRRDTSENDHTKYTRRLIEHYGIKEHDLESTLPRLFQYYRFSLREMERCFSILSLYYAQLTPNRLSNDATINFLAVLRVRHPTIFKGLAERTISHEELIEKTNIDKIDRLDYTRFQKDWFQGLLRFYLLTDKEYEAVDEKEKSFYQQAFWQYSFPRTDIMPFFCEELSRFKLDQP